MPIGTVSPAAARDHIARLRAARVTLPTIAARSGVHQSTIERIARGAVAKIVITTHRGILSVAVPAAPAPAHDRQNRTYPHLVEGTGTRRRVQALFAAGHLRARIASMYGCDADRIYRLARGHGYVYRETAAAVDRVYRLLRHQVGPCRRTASWARRNGWALPWQWTAATIDDPEAYPQEARVA